MAISGIFLVWLLAVCFKYGYKRYVFSMAISGMF